MYWQIIGSLLAITLTMFSPLAAFAQPMVSPNRIVSFQANIQDGNLLFATSLASPIGAPTIHYQSGQNDETLLLADFPYIVYPFPHQIMTTGTNSALGGNHLSSDSFAEHKNQIERIGFEQLATTPPIFRVTVVAKNPEAFKNISFQADYGRLIISWGINTTNGLEAPRLEEGKHKPVSAPVAIKPDAADSYQLLFTTNSLIEEKNFVGATVILDPGHGGSDPGAQRDGISEKEITLAIVNTLKKFLEDKGIKVVLTRCDDNFVSLEDRVRLANATSPDLFLSVHINSLQRDSEVQGVETYYKTPQSKVLAESIHDSLVGGLGIPDRLVRKARFYVINHTEAPAVLAEVGYISSQEERERLISSDYQDRVATALEHGVIVYLAKQKELALQREVEGEKLVAN